MSEDTIVSTFHAQVERLGDRRAMRCRHDGEWRDITWREYGDRVREVAILQNLRPAKSLKIYSFHLILTSTE